MDGRTDGWTDGRMDGWETESDERENWTCFSRLGIEHTVAAGVAPQMAPADRVAISI